MVLVSYLAKYLAREEMDHLRFDIQLLPPPPQKKKKNHEEVSGNFTNLKSYKNQYIM